MTRGPAPSIGVDRVPPNADAVLVRVGAIGTKSERVRYEMQSQLGRNLRALLADRGIDAPVRHRRNRLVIEPTASSDQAPDPAGVAAAVDAATDAAGVVSASPAMTVAPTMAAVTDALAAVAIDRFDGGSFAVRANRVGDHPFTSEELEREGGSAVFEAVADPDPTVDLEDPDLTFRADVADDEAFVFVEKHPGPGGLPLGSQRPVVALLSGGIDSPVAAFELMRRGVPVTPAYLDLGDFGGPDHRARAEESARQLARYAPNHLDAIHVADAGDVCRRLADTIEQGRMLVFRRFMYRVAADIAADRGATGVVTGEVIGQKSSQTTQNLSVLDSVTDFPIHRPLLTLDKPTITERAERIGTRGTADITVGCDRFAPDRVETRAGLDQIADVEPEWLRDAARDAADGAERVLL
ncbi:thiamine biosynthesis protein ThiI [Halopenitus malekzadehii]|uniref:Probable tRNA sulfurtransferase n=1 Tax=Halopenitus malekzadehii TaxID=1267564 RepID=A0A1H6IPA5_9EURY|nr:THUMP domain-containing protein [Halopenitus malekzadehii]SEH51571.1 thiamine biosynthesis protein ThiI [Halopenitus malekzadehii]